MGPVFHSCTSRDASNPIGAASTAPIAVGAGAGGSELGAAALPGRDTSSGIAPAACAGEPAAREHGVAAARLAMGKMPGELAAFPGPRGDGGVRPSQASITARVRWQRRPLISSSYSSASRRRARNRVLSTTGRDISEPRADLAVGQALELAQDEDPVMELGHPAERAAQILELLLALDRDVGAGRGARDSSFSPPRSLPFRVERDLAAAPSPPELVDAGVLGDLVDPRLERDRSFGLPQPAQDRDEHLLGDVLGPVDVADDPADVRRGSACDTASTAARRRCPRRAGPPPQARGRCATRSAAPLEAAVPSPIVPVR